MPSKIFIDEHPSGSQFFFAGDTISGRVELTSTTSKICTKASISFYSSEEISVKNGNIRLSGNCKNFDFSLTFIETAQKLEVGTVSFAFSFTLPLSTKLATLGPIRGKIREEKFSIKTELKFTAEFKGFLASDEKATIPVQVAPLWAPNMNSIVVGKSFDSVLELERSCGCFEDKKYAKIEIQGLNPAVHFQDRVCIPMAVSIQHSADVDPVRMGIQLLSKTSVSHFYSKELAKTEHYSRIFTFSKENEKLSTLACELSFVALPFALMTAKGSYWNREFYWKIQVEYRGGYSTSTKIPVIACALPSIENLSAVQKVLIEYAYLYPKVPKVFSFVVNEDVIEKKAEESVEEESIEEKQEGEQEITDQLESTKLESEEQTISEPPEDAPLSSQPSQNAPIQPLPSQHLLSREYFPEESIKSEIQ